MRYPWLVLALQLVAAPPALAATPVAAPIMLHAADGVKVYASYYPAMRAKAVILLFHQAGSSKDEYRSIAPRLAAQGYSALAVDQRSGGSLFGRNETAAGIGADPGFLDAAKDLDAAIRWARARKLPIVLWGSSYSAALVILEAARQTDVKAVLAFSPGEYLGDANPVRRAAAKIHIPLYVTSASDPREIAAARTIVVAAPTQIKRQFIARRGIHGSSTLIAQRNPLGADDNWASVEAFLRRVLP